MTHTGANFKSVPAIYNFTDAQNQQHLSFVTFYSGPDSDSPCILRYMELLVERVDKF
jgi:hypothetical protein